MLSGMGSESWLKKKILIFYTQKSTSKNSCKLKLWQGFLGIIWLNLSHISNCYVAFERRSAEILVNLDFPQNSWVWMKVSFKTERCSTNDSHVSRTQFDVAERFLYRHWEQSWNFNWILLLIETWCECQNSSLADKNPSAEENFVCSHQLQWGDVLYVCYRLILVAIVNHRNFSRCLKFLLSNLINW